MLGKDHPLLVFFLLSLLFIYSESLSVDDKRIEYCSTCIYLGSPFKCDGSVSSAVRIHAREKMCHVLKFVSFLKNNNGIPFVVKRRVSDAVLMSMLLLGCGSCFGADMKPIEKL